MQPNTVTSASVSGTVCVTEYGAAGDGMTDDTDAIQAALSSGARQVLVPAGTFIITNALKPAAGQCLHIDGELKVGDAVIQALTRDVAVGDSEVMVEDGSRYRVGQWVTLHDEQLPIHMIAWVESRSGETPTHGAFYQTRRTHAGNARITEISGNTLKLDASSARSYLVSEHGCLATQHSAILVEHSHVRICGTGIIDGNKHKQLDAGPHPLAGGGEDSRVGCGIKVEAAGELTNITIEGITVRNAILHNISMGTHNNDVHPDSLVTESVIRNVCCLQSHDKNIVIGCCRDCSILNNLAAHAAYEDGIILHQVGDGNDRYARRILIQGNRCIGNARMGLHVGANNREIFMAGNLCADNGTNLTINGDNCTSNGDVVSGCNGRLFRLEEHRPSALIAGRRIMVSHLTVTNSHGVGLGLSGEDITVSTGLISRETAAAEPDNDVGIAVVRGSAKDGFGGGLQPIIVLRQTDVFADRVRISGVRVKGFRQGIRLAPGARNVVLHDNDLDDNLVACEIAESSWTQPVSPPT